MSTIKKYFNFSSLLKTTFKTIVVLALVCIIALLVALNYIEFAAFFSLGLDFFDVYVTPEQIKKLNLDYIDTRLSTALYVYSLILIFCWYLIHKKWETLLIFQVNFFNKSKIVVKSFFASDNVLLFVLVLTVLSILSFYIPLQTDELFTFNHFVSKGVFVSWLYYPGPNNHVLFSIFCSLLYKITGSPTIALRGINIVLYASLFVGLFIAAKKKSKVGLAMILLHPVLVYYAVSGRGYILMVFSVSLIFNVLYSEKEKVSGTLPFIFSMAGLGLCVSPLFVLALLPFVLLLCRSLAGMRILRYGVVVGVGVISFYLPIWVFSGSRNLLANSWVIGNGIGIDKYFNYLTEVGNYLFFNMPYGWVLLWSIGGVYVFNRFSIGGITLILSMLLLPWILGVLPPSRAFVIFIPLIFIELLYMKTLKLVGLRLVVFICFMFGWTATGKEIFRNVEYYREIQEKYELVIASDTKVLFTNDDTVLNYFNYKNVISNKRVLVNYNRSNNTGRPSKRPFWECNSEKLSKEQVLEDDVEYFKLIKK